MRTECKRSRSVAWIFIFALWTAFAHADTSANATAGTPGQDYRVGPGDLLRVTVFGSPELSTDARVAQSGTITVSLIGSVNVAGQSSAEVERTLAQKFIDGGFLKQPQVSVLIVEYISQKVSVLYAGKVVEEGDTAAMFAVPRHAYTRALMAATPRYTDPLASLKPVDKEVLDGLAAEMAAADHDWRAPHG